MPGWIAFTRRGAQLDDQSVHQTGDAGVDGTDSHPAWVGTVLGPSTEQHDRAVLRQPVSHRADDGGVTQELHGDEIARRGNVVVVEGVGVSGDRRKYEMVDCAYVGQRVRDLLRLGEVQSDTTCVAAQLGSHRLGS